MAANIIPIDELRDCGAGLTRTERELVGLFVKQLRRLPDKKLRVLLFWLADVGNDGKNDPPEGIKVHEE